MCLNIMSKFNPHTTHDPIQDFDDWDDVGLNISKPPDLLYLFRNYSTCMLSDKEKVDRIKDLVSILNKYVSQTTQPYQPRWLVLECVFVKTWPNIIGQSHPQLFCSPIILCTGG